MKNADILKSIKTLVPTSLEEEPGPYLKAILLLPCYQMQRQRRGSLETIVQPWNRVLAPLQGIYWASVVAQLVKKLPAMQKTMV